MNPYTVVGSPSGASYAAPLLNFGQMLGLNNQNQQQGQGQSQSQQLTAQYAQLLQKLFGNSGSGGSSFSGGNIGGTGGNLGGVY